MDGPFSTPLWDLSQASTFSQLPEDEFLQLLQKQFPTAGAPTDIFGSDQGIFVDGVNPQNTQLPGLTPPSDDSSPSPPSMNDAPSRRQSTAGSGDHELKRKASDDSLEEGGPDPKHQHTEDTGVKKTTTRKKTGGGDESRLLKRKEQNRAAQRAFRERKEKHVKDLEDKVAALEAKNDEKSSENENLKDLLTRLQNENMTLKQTQTQSQFTFSAPKDMSMNSVAGPSDLSRQTASPPAGANNMNDLDWNSLTTFDPSMLALLDEPPQMTATDTSGQMGMGVDIFSGAGSSQGLGKTPFTTIASNPMFMSFADFGSPGSASSSTSSFGMNANNTNLSNGGDSFSTGASPFTNFGMSAWPSPQTSNTNGSSYGDLDNIFGGGANQLGDQPGLIDFSALLKSPPSQAVSPVSHASQRHNSTASASTASPSLTDESSMFSKDSPPTDVETPQLPPGQEHDVNKCPKTKEQAARLIRDSGASPFAPAPPSSTSPAPGSEGAHIWKGEASDGSHKPQVMCTGGALPRTTASEKNVEVLSAWKSITSNPHFRDTDINDLCQQFTAKARCDGTKVVLEPSGVQHILQSLASKKGSPSPTPDAAKAPSS